MNSKSEIGLYVDDLDEFNRLFNFVKAKGIDGFLEYLQNEVEQLEIEHNRTMLQKMQQYKAQASSLTPRASDA